jgi:hypothetical protein
VVRLAAKGANGTVTQTGGIPLEKPFPPSKKTQTYTPTRTHKQYTHLPHFQGTSPTAIVTYAHNIIITSNRKPVIILRKIKRSTPYADIRR